MKEVASETKGKRHLQVISQPLDYATQAKKKDPKRERIIPSIYIMKQGQGFPCRLKMTPEHNTNEEAKLRQKRSTRKLFELQLNIKVGPLKRKVKSADVVRQTNCLSTRGLKEKFKISCGEIVLWIHQLSNSHIFLVNQNCGKSFSLRQPTSVGVSFTIRKHVIQQEKRLFQ